MNVFSSDEIAEIVCAQDDVFDTFKEKILIFQTPLKTYINSSVAGYNFAFGDSTAGEVIHTPVSGFFDATIEYLDQRYSQKLTKREDTRITTTDGYVRICVSGDANEFLRSCKTINFDGDEFAILSDKVPRGIFGRKYFDYWLSKPEK